MGRKPYDISREYCTIIDNNSSHVRCNFCGHQMQGITRFKEHLAGKRGDVSPCKCCPDDVKAKIALSLIQLSLKREEKEKRTREALRKSIENAFFSLPPTPRSPPSLTLVLSNDYNKKRPAAAAVADLEAEERALMEKVMEESIQTFEMEKKKVKYEEHEVEAAIRESMRSYKEEAWRRGEGCSKYAKGGTSSSFGNYYNYESIDVDLDFGSSDDEDF